ncbi:phosphatidylinositol-specific phospholipase C [Enterococcus faecium]|uniref:phosphatidylinositol-specific phospholipase C n=1 Tax=Enterococcus TaxID=1350 RepID=UPI000CF17F3F|nr:MULTISPECIES: phosphatidylinositol-specific phospholipase C [Enterococcus]EGP4715661.1 phosphatidylinositol-specific phospholipase C [Enterococcus faecium]EGP4827559.1 phosphatidylinositol-specific phospholipase C [Enterococcus faecium]EGP4888646.1 phosphatidylinositol-specific phospholipase C [Enterococcus faecium]EGP5051711.1 phosphatidylinositol-specific phospholipase C [Enterococcus faecium]EGP5222694.1 phosphatidylinositol-specific phospholipase C domain-containing protein [Enterococcu
MNKKKFTVLLCICFGLFLLGYKTPMSYAHINGGDWSSRTYNRYWMSELNDNVRLSELSIPGTHNSATGTFSGIASGYVKTQSIDIRKQLDNGIRFLDIRARAIDGAFTMHHDRYYLNQNFGDVLNKTVAFLRDNPGEVVYMRLKQEYSSVNDHTFNHILNTRYLQDSRWRDYFYYGNANPTLRETRGKIVIFCNFLGNNVGIPYPSSFDIQDYWNPVNPNDKRWAVEQQFDKAHQSRGINGVKYINYLSANGFWNGVWGYADVINHFSFYRIINRNIKHTGIVPIDYPSEWLVNSIIDINHRLLKDRESKGKYDGYITSIQCEADTSKVVDWNQGNNRGIIYHNAGSRNQKWYLDYDVASKAYILRSQRNRDHVLAENSSFGIDVTNQPSIQNRARWRLLSSGLEHMLGDVYYLQNAHSNRILEVRDGVYNNNQELITAPVAHIQRQRFVINRED